MLPVGINTSKILYLTGNSLISSSVNTFFNARITALKIFLKRKSLLGELQHIEGSMLAKYSCTGFPSTSKSH